MNSKLAWLTFAALALAWPSLASAGCSIDSYDRHVLVVNRTTSVMTKLNASIVDTNSWEENILHREILNPGESAIVDIDDCTGYCRYDLRAVFDDDRYATRWNVNVCDMQRWTISE